MAPSTKNADTQQAPSSKNRAGRVAIAQSTLSAIAAGSYTHPTAGTIAIPEIERTVYYPPSQAVSIPAPSSPTQDEATNTTTTQISILPLTTLAATTHLLSTLPTAPSNTASPTTTSSSSRATILNFASATKPGGGYLTGAQAQEESIARSSNLSASSLESKAGRPFHELCKRDKRGCFYTDAVVYTEGVSILRNDDGKWLPAPQRVDAVTAAAVNAGVVRKRARGGDNSSSGNRNQESWSKKKIEKQKKKKEASEIWYKQQQQQYPQGDNNPNPDGTPSTSEVPKNSAPEADGGEEEEGQAKGGSQPHQAPSPEQIELQIAAAMRKRMTRILAICLHHQARNLVLGSFGTGVFQNNVEMVARTWMQLLRSDEFVNRFERVVFGVLDAETVELWTRIAKEEGVVVKER